MNGGGRDSRKVMVPQEVRILILGICGCVVSRGRRDLADGTKLRVWRWGDCSVLSWWARNYHKGLDKGRMEAAVRGSGRRHDAGHRAQRERDPRPRQGCHAGGGRAPPDPEGSVSRSGSSGERILP